MKKKNGGAGKTKAFSVSLKIPPTNKKKRRVLVFNPPRGARTFHTSKLYQSTTIESNTDNTNKRAF